MSSTLLAYNRRQVESDRFARQTNRCMRMASACPPQGRRRKRYQRVLAAPGRRVAPSPVSGPGAVWFRAETPCSHCSFTFARQAKMAQSEPPIESRLMRASLCHVNVPR